MTRNDANRIFDMATRFLCIVVAIALLGCSGFKATSVNPAQGQHLPAANRRMIAFVDVNVVPMDGERVLERQTLIVRDGRIAVMGEADRIEVPKEALRVDGRGRYLMPGLVDMHVHLYTPQELPLYLAHGVTTVFNLWGRPAHLNWRERIARGEILGPTIYTCGPIIFRADTADEARQMVEAQSKAGYDAIKIYNDVSKEAYPVLTETARRNKMLVVGHIPRSVGLEGVLHEHQAIAHAEEFVYTAFNWKLDESRIPAVVAATREAGVPVTLTLVFYDHILRQSRELLSFLKNPEMKYLAPWAGVLWGPGLNRYNPRLSALKDQQFLEKSLNFQKTLAKRLHQAGVKILAGTDAMTPGAVPGFTLLEELQNLAGLGLTPFEVIRAATRYPAEFLSPNHDFGTVAVGQRADLLLVAGNPLADLTNLQCRVGVMARGDWRTEAQLQEMLEEIPGTYARAERYAEWLLTRDPSAASRYIEENDPFEYVTLAAELNLITREGVGPFRKIHRDLQKVRPDAEMFGEENLNVFAHRMLELDRKKEAIELLVMNLETHPGSAKACHRLAEAYLKNGDKELAIEYYKKALAIDPKFKSSLEALKKLAP